ncbi:transcription initiation factor TFIID subunit 5 isoform X2 [Hyalella azteca]|uniref:Transcription initiation factor TFIID subunit 5 n=1 Tax=Hyalella azteca TaxID=294128 RepID=A0A8B7PAJ4_HYAAZ|nr:transcription initiation factor TFIID subunit 5 isoform X2 [Hyalella azteca]
MDDSDSPTYASLAPANPTMVNDLASVDLPSLSNIPDVNSNGHLPSAVQSPLSGQDVSSPQTPASLDMKSDGYSDMDKSTMIAVIQFLKRGNLKSTEEILRKECGFFEPVDVTDTSGALGEEGEVLAAYKSDGNPAEYQDAFKALSAFVEKSLDAYKYEVAAVLYPVLIHMYLELIYNGHRGEAVELLQNCSSSIEAHHADDLRSISLVTSRAQMAGQPLLNTLLSAQYTCRMSRDSLAHLKRFLADRSAGPVPRIIQDRLNIDLVDGQPRTKAQVLAVQGAITGEAPRSANKTKIFYGLLKEPELQTVINEEEEAEDDLDKPKKKKSKKDALQKNKKNDPNAPPANRIPLPELRDQDKQERARIYRDSMKRVTLSRDALPSICFYSFVNASNTVCSVDISDDSSILAFGSAESILSVHSITPAKLKAMKPAEQLSDIDKDSEDVLVRMLDDRSGETQRNLMGHSGPVTAVSVSPDKALLASSGQDGTVRIWSLQTWTCVVVLRGHIYPVWSVRFSPHGYYLVTGGHDRTARLWTTDQHLPLRIFAGHYSDVDVVEFHPNSNYVASGSSDRSVRLWDCSNGACVRIFTGHKGTVSAVNFSPCGRYLASGSCDARILVWDLGGHGNALAALSSHSDTIHTLAFSREGTILASGSMDCTVKIWDFAKVTEEGRDEDVNATTSPLEDKSLLLSTFPTKQTPVLSLHFTRRNVLLASGPFNG